jgi:hypothetical protein
MNRDDVITLFVSLVLAVMFIIGMGKFYQLQQDNVKTCKGAVELCAQTEGVACDAVDRLCEERRSAK